jgi:hypothetical protein
MAGRVTAEFRPLFRSLTPALRRRFIALLAEVARVTRRRVRREGARSRTLPLTG